MQVFIFAELLGNWRNVNGMEKKCRINSISILCTDFSCFFFSGENIEITFYCLTDDVTD